MKTDKIIRYLKDNCNNFVISKSKSQNMNGDENIKNVTLNSSNTVKKSLIANPNCKKKKKNIRLSKETNDIINTSHVKNQLKKQLKNQLKK